VSRAVAAIVNRLGSTAEEWQARLEMLRQGRFLGRYFATTRDRLRASPSVLGCSGYPTWVAARRPDPAMAHHS